MRLFAAVLPPSDVLDHAERALEAVGARDASLGAPGAPAATARWVPQGDRHLTLAFYGDLPEGMVPELEQELAAVAHATSPFEVSLRGAGLFQDRVLWMGVGGDTDALRRLSGECAEASPGPLRQDARPNRPHLTVARLARTGRGAGGGGRGGRSRWGRRGGWQKFDPPSPLDPLSRALSVYAGPAWSVRDFALVESHPGQGAHGGPLYRTVASWELGTAD